MLFRTRTETRTRTTKLKINDKDVYALDRWLVHYYESIGRVGLDVAYYTRKMTDAVLNASLAKSTGYTNVWLNSGKMSGNGIEATLNLNILDKEDYGWNSQINYTSNENIVDELAPGLQRLFLAGFSSAGTYLVAGNQYGAIFGGAYLRTGAGGPNDDELNIPEGDVVSNDDPTS